MWRRGRGRVNNKKKWSVIEAGGLGSTHLLCRQWWRLNSDTHLNLICKLFLLSLLMPTANYYSQKGGDNASSSVCSGIRAIWVEMHVSHKEKETPGAQTIHWHFIWKALHLDSFTICDPSGITTIWPSYSWNAQDRRNIAFLHISASVLFVLFFFFFLSQRQSKLDSVRGSMRS